MLKFFNSYYTIVQFLTISFVLNIFILLLFILIGGILPLYERKFLSLTQRRIGPKYVGYKGRLQFLADAVKVLLKDYVNLFRVNIFLFFLTPIVYLNLNLLIFINLFWLNNQSLFDIEYNIVFIILLDILLHFLIALTGLLLQNKYTIVSSSRLLNIMYTTELFTTLILTTFLIIINSFSLQKILCLKNSYKICFLFSVLTPVLIIFFLLETAKTPFDAVEAETEIIMGYHVEFSGFLFGLYVLSEYFHVVLYIYILLQLFF